MADNPRIEDLRRRVQKDPASIAFAQLAEEYRRAGQYHESIDACRVGLAIHPGYLSARVTLGRALIEIGQLDDAHQELGVVLKSAPENLAAIRGTADIHHKQGRFSEALEFYRTALSMARNDPDLEQTVTELTHQLAPIKGPEPADGLSFEDMRREMAARVPPPPPGARVPRPDVPVPVAAAARVALPPPRPDGGRVFPDPVAARVTSAVLPAPANGERERAVATIAALEEWLGVIHVTRAYRPS